MKAKTFRSLLYENGNIKISLRRSSYGTYLLEAAISSKNSAFTWREIDSLTSFQEATAIYSFLQRIDNRALIALWETLQNR